MALDLRLSQHQKLDLQLKLAPQIIQSIEILQLPAIDLARLIEAELDINEYLESSPDDAAQDEESSSPQTTETVESTEAAKEASDREAEVDRMESLGVWDEEVPRFKSAINQEASDRKQEAMNNTAGREPSLHEKLMEQFRMLELEGDERIFGEMIITHINLVGRFDADLEMLRLSSDLDLDTDEAEGVLIRLQSLEPRGIAARSTAECLTLQLDPKDTRFEMKRRLIAEHLEDLAKNRRPKITKSLGIDFDELDDLVRELSELDYQPGVSLADESPGYIYPDVVIDWAPHGYDVRLANEPYSDLRLNDDFREVLRNKALPSEYKDSVRKKVDNAKWLISALEQRQGTLLRVARKIIEYQRDFLDFGPHYLRPLKMQQVADDLGIHVSTVSRATHEKYMQTHRGIFSMKFFFTGAASSVDGGIESRASVKQRVKEIIDAEDKKKPLSDEVVVKRLKDNFGVEVARRTVTKYRKALAIPSTRQRRVY